jgi:ubiquinone/menaquinone biosynthesis C-methylase UbiE
MDININKRQEYYERTAGSREKWKRRNRFYHRYLEKSFSFIIPPNSRVLEVGCGPGDLLAAVRPSYGVGIDFSPTILETARKKYPGLEFLLADVEDFTFDGNFDFIILSDLVGTLLDVQKVLNNIKKFCHPGTRIIISNYNFLWEPFLVFGEKIHVKLAQPKQNWLSNGDLDNLLQLAGFQIITIQKKLLFPKYIPIINFLFNRILANLPLIRSLDLVNLIIARPFGETRPEYSVSIVVPARNERGNIEDAIKRTPEFGSHQEFLFVEGHSADQTYEEMLRVKEAYADKDIKVMKQTGKGKGNAVRDGFEAATGEVLMILDADLTTPPESMELFYRALQQNKGEFINGCRLVYPMEQEAMRFLNLMANKFFALLFTYLLGQRLKDTLCGTKVLLASDYQDIKDNRSYFGDFDPFGDFDLLFGAAKLNMKFVEIPVRYKQRMYGSTQISRFKHGILLFRMCFFAARKIKFM